MLKRKGLWGTSNYLISHFFFQNDESEETEIKESDRFTITEGTLHVKALLPSDQGIYTCVASNPLDSVTRTVNIKVFSKSFVICITSKTFILHKIFFIYKAKK